MKQFKNSQSFIKRMRENFIKLTTEEKITVLKHRLSPLEFDEMLYSEYYRTLLK